MSRKRVPLNQNECTDDFRIGVPFEQNLQYSQGIILKNILFSSGQIPASPETGEIVGTDITAQAEQVMENVKAILDEAGTCFENVVKTTCFLSDMADFAEFNKVYEKYFVSKPARSCVAVKALPKNVLCEVEVIAEIR